MQLGQEYLSKGIGYDENHLEAETFKADIEVKKEGPLDFTSLKQGQDQSILEDKPGTYGYSKMDDLTNAPQNGCKLAPCSLPFSVFEMVKKERGFYMDKAVTDMELPKMIVCYKEGSYHIIKDICIDEGLPSFGSVLVHSAVKDEKIYSDSKLDTDDFTNKDISDGLNSSSLNRHSIADVNNEVIEASCLTSAQEVCGDISQTADEVISSQSQEKNFDESPFPPKESDRCLHQEHIIDIQNGNTLQRTLASLLEEDRGNTDIAEEIVHTSETELLPVQELDRGHADLSSSQSNINQPQLVNSDIGQQNSNNSDSEESRSNEVDSHQLKSIISRDRPHLASIPKNSSQSFDFHDRSDWDQADEGPLEEANSISGVSSEELKEESKAKDLLGIGDLGDNIVAFDIDTEPPATIPKNDREGTFEIQQSGLVSTGSMLEDTSTDVPAASSRTSFSHGHADTNFPAPVSLSGRIAYSGQIPYSGSISLRSDSSTTSTRSFAFPILQSEWNTSPVRMAKADRRHFRRHRGWRSGLFCCRF